MRQVSSYEVVKQDESLDPFGLLPFFYAARAIDGTA